MSGKFMRIKKIIVPTLTMLLIASQLSGCSAASQNEMLQMLQNQQSITIEVAEPISEEQGEEKSFEWIELASLTTYPEFRDTVDDTIGVTPFGEGGKNGVIYADLDGNHTNNSTLSYAFNNQKFLDKVWNNTDTIKAIIEATKENYADIETDAQAKLAFINAYFNILNDAEPNYFNGNSTITRAEFMGAIYKASNPVQEITASEAFSDLVDPNGDDSNTLFASQVDEYSYLSTADKSLNDKTFNGTITRAEAIYTLVKTYFNEEYEATTGTESAYTDTKNAGNLLEQVAKKVEGGLEGKSFLKSYELSYSIQNADKGMPTDLYKAMVVAKKLNLINGTESLWDEGLTKAQCLDLITKTYEIIGANISVDRGEAQGEVIENTVPEEETVVEKEETSTKEEPVEKIYPYSGIDLKEAIKPNGDGTYSYSEEFMSAIMMYEYFEGATDKEIKDYLDTKAKLILRSADTMPEEGLHNLFTGETGRLHVGTTPNTQGTSSNTGSTSPNQSSTPQNNQGGNNNSGSTPQVNPESQTPTPPSSESSGSSADWDLGPAFDGCHVGPIGGGGRLETGATLHSGG